MKYKPVYSTSQLQEFEADIAPLMRPNYGEKEYSEILKGALRMPSLWKNFWRMTWRKIMIYMIFAVIVIWRHQIQNGVAEN